MAFQPFKGVNDLRNVVLLDQWAQFNEIFIQNISFMIKSIKYIGGSPRDHSSTLYSICDHNCSPAWRKPGADSGEKPFEGFEL